MVLLLLSCMVQPLPRLLKSYVNFQNPGRPGLCKIQLLPQLFRAVSMFFILSQIRVLLTKKTCIKLTIPVILLFPNFEFFLPKWG